MKFTPDDFAMFANADEICDYLNDKLDKLTQFRNDDDFVLQCADYIFEKWLAGEYDDSLETVYFVEEKAVGE